MCLPDSPSPSRVTATPAASPSSSVPSSSSAATARIAAARAMVGSAFSSSPRGPAATAPPTVAVPALAAAVGPAPHHPASPAQQAAVPAVFSRLPFGRAIATGLLNIYHTHSKLSLDLLFWVDRVIPPDVSNGQPPQVLLGVHHPSVLHP